MAKRIAVLAAHQRATDKPFFEKKSIVRSWIRRAEAFWIEEGKLAQLLTRRTRTAYLHVQGLTSSMGYIDGPMGVGQLLPFAKADCSGALLHYEIPMAGDRRLDVRHTPYRVNASPRGREGRNILAALQMRAAAAALAG